MFKQLFQRRRRPAIISTDALGVFLDQNASLIAQKTVMGYCTVKTMLPVGELMGEQRFADALEISRWEAYAAALADLVMVAEGRLRPAASGLGAEIAARLADLHAKLLSAHPAPAHHADGWASHIAAMRQRLATAQIAPRLGIADIAKISAERIYDTLPIHERLREPDKPAVIANVQFMMVGLAHRFDAEIDSTAVAADLLGPARAS